MVEIDIIYQNCIDIIDIILEIWICLNEYELLEYVLMKYMYVPFACMCHLCRDEKC